MPKKADQEWNEFGALNDLRSLLMKQILKWKGTEENLIFALKEALEIASRKTEPQQGPRKGIGRYSGLREPRPRKK